MDIIALIRKPLSFLGIDRPVAYTLIGRGWSILAGPITLLLLVSFLSPEEQGFYYTYGSVIALNAFFELGLSFVILQFASHEKAKLVWTSKGTLEGDQTAKERLSSILRMALKWYSVAAAFMMMTILPIGLFFFKSHQYTTIINWQIPWVWLVLGSATNLLISPLLAVIEGCGLVAQVAAVRAGQSIFTSLSLWLALSRHWGLYACPITQASGVLWIVSWLVVRKRTFLSDVLSSSGVGVVSWWREVWPFQWKIALSWVSGYLIFQLFNPVMFAFYGPVAAGQMGMSLTIVSAISALAMSWMETKAAPFGSLIAQKDFSKLDRIFFKTLWQTLGVVTLGGGIFYVATLYLQIVQHPWRARLLAPLPLALLVATVILNQVIFAEALYLRAHKEEPFVWMSVLGGCLVGLSTYFLGRQFGAVGIMAGYFGLTLFIGIGVDTWIFLAKRRLWHEGT